MAVIQLKGFITETGELAVQLPPGLPAGEALVTIELPAPVEAQDSADETPWTEAEIRDLMRVEPLSGAEIVAAGLTGGWEHLGIEDSVAWVEALRRRRREQRGW